MTPQTRLSPCQLHSAPDFPVRFTLRVSGLCVAFALCAAAVPARAQQVALAANTFAAAAQASSPFTASTLDGEAESSSGSPDNNLPDAPSAPLRASFSQAAPEAGVHTAPLYTENILPGWTAQPLSGHQKFVYGLRELYDPLSFADMFVSAGWEQVTNGAPNYGTDRGAFGERLGAAAIRDSSQAVLSDAIFAPMFHQDPRYYMQGPGRSFVHRVLYAASRPLITRTDSGRSTVNSSQLLGYAGAAALSYTYYPKVNQNAKDTFSTYYGSIIGSALGYLYHEFSPQLFQAMHLEKKQ